MSGATPPHLPRPSGPRLVIDVLVLLIQLLLPVLLVALVGRLMTQPLSLAHALLVVGFTYSGIFAGRALGAAVALLAGERAPNGTPIVASASADRVRGSWEARLADLVATLGGRGMIREGTALARLLMAYQSYRAPDQADVDVVVELEDRLGDDSPVLSDLVVLLVVIHDRLLHTRTTAEVS